MRSPRPITTLLAAMFIAIVMASPAHASVKPGAIPLQSAGSPGPGWIRADNDFVIWSEQIQRDRFVRFANLYVASLDNQRPIQLAANLAFAPSFGPLAPGFDLDNGIAVWINASFDNPTAQGILAQDLRSGRRWTIVDARAAIPTIDGALVAWWEGLGWGGKDADREARLMIRDIDAMSAPRKLATITSPRDSLIHSMRVGQNWVVWLQGDYDQGVLNPPCWRLFAIAIDGGPSRTIANLGCGDGLDLAIDLAGSRIAYTGGDHVLAVYDLASGALQACGAHSGSAVTWAGRLLVWISTEDSQAWACALDSNSMFPIDAPRIDWPAIGGGGATLAWFISIEGGFAVQIHPLDRQSPVAPPTPEEAAGAGRLFFPETNHTLGGVFRDFWQANGGLAVFGYPLTEEFIQRVPGADQSYVVQYFERQRFELHTENSGTPYLVLLGQLGTETLAASGRDWRRFATADPTSPHYAPQTEQAIDPLFWNYWRTHGLELGDPGISERESLALWGYPISPLMRETPEGGDVLWVQWFERARFEYHPENSEPYRVLLGRLAAEQVTRIGLP